MINRCCTLRSAQTWQIAGTMQERGDVNQASGLLANVQVLELAQRIAGPYCGKILAHLGATVLKVEPPAGDSARQLGPFP